MNKIHNGMSAIDIADVRWRKSKRSGQGNCVELAELADGGYAMRNSRFPSGPALIFTKAEMDAFFGGVHDGEFASR